MSDMPDRFNYGSDEPVTFIGGPKSGRVIMIPRDTNTITVGVFVDRCEHVPGGHETRTVTYRRGEGDKRNTMRMDLEYDALTFLCATCVGQAQADRVLYNSREQRFWRWWHSHVNDVRWLIKDLHRTIRNRKYVCGECGDVYDGI